MFGFLRGSRRDRVYRQVYAGCCAVQQQQFGKTSVAFLSYESIFVYLLAMDARACQTPPDQAPTCCRLRSNSRTRSAVDPSIAEFSAAMGLLLASIKLDDDVADDHSLVARMTRWWLRKPIKKSRDYFKALDPEFPAQLQARLTAHQRLEQTGGPVALDQYVGPTAEAFGYVFRLMSACLLQLEPETNTTFEQVGAAIGAAIITFDCAVDWHNDRRKKRFNPLPTKASIARSLQQCRRELARAMWLCGERWGHSSLSVQVLRQTFHRTTQIELGRSRKKPSWATFRKAGWPVLRRGDCDCCCPCDAGCGCDNPVDLDCIGESGCGHAPCCDSASCCDPCGGQPAKQKKPLNNEIIHAPLPEAQIGSTGTSVGPLNPTGIVQINGTEHPAKSDGSWIGDNQPVEVIGIEMAGLIVRPISGHNK